MRKDRESVTETERILDQMLRAFEGEAWHGPSVRKTLEDVSAGLAAARTIPGAHTIWELVLHIAAWKSAVRRRLEGDRAQLTDNENWPPITETNEAAWIEAKMELERAHQGLVTAVAGLDARRLDEPILAELPSIYVTLHGVIQHELYHTGQIAILKKAAGATI
jgi:uncharacterized damage-inducible protein DinB